MFEEYKAFKEKVGVDDVAAYLGYKLDRKAGVGKYVEYNIRVRLTPLSSVTRATNPARPTSIGTEPVAAMPSV